MNVKFVMLSSQSFTSFVLYNRFLNEQAKYCAGVFEFPYLEFSTEKKRDRSLRILKRSSLTYFIFKFLTVILYYPIAKIFGRDLKSVCAARGIAYHDCRNGMTPDVEAAVRACEPDLIFNASALILNESILQIPKVGCMSFHGARLPEFRGAANYFWVLVEGQKQTQATLHFVEKGLDTGPIIEFGQPVDISIGMSVFEVYLEVLKTGHALLTYGFNLVLAGKKVKVSQQDHANATMRSLPRASDVKRLRDRGHGVISLSDVIKMIGIIRRGV